MALAILADNLLNIYKYLLNKYLLNIKQIYNIYNTALMLFNNCACVT